MKQLTGSRKWKNIGGERHQIGTGHGPMVQGRLLTAHPGEIHGHGGSPGGVISLRQGAWTSSSVDQIGKTAVADEQKGFRRGQLLI